MTPRAQRRYRKLPQVMRYKPGSRCTVLYHLEYDNEPDAVRNWPDLVVAKTYSQDKGRNAYTSMRKLWASPLSQGNIGFIDFDGFCLAEPALDIALFRATTKELGINTSPSGKQKKFVYDNEEAHLVRLHQLDEICEVFLSEYERLGTVSRERVALWEALDLLTVVLRCWTKVKPHQLSNAMLLLETHLRSMGL